MTETIRDAVAKRGDTTPAPQPGGVLALTDDQTWWTPRQIAALKAMGVKNATQEDLLVFLHYCAKTKLDPFSRQVYMLERRTWNKQRKEWEYQQTIQVGIDGYRVVAQRAAARQGVELEYEDTVWFDAQHGRHDVWLEDEPPAAALVVAVKVTPDGRKLRYPAVARFSSYAAYSKATDDRPAQLQGQWVPMPDHMIEKCAEAFSLRRAFPNDLGGTYAEEEMQHEQPPTLPVRSRSVSDGDEGVVPAAGVDDSVPEATEDTPPEGDPAERRSANAKLNAFFRRYQLHGAEHAETRRGVILGIINVTRPVALTQLTPTVLLNVAGQLADRINAYPDQTPEATIRAELVDLADETLTRLAEKEQEAQK